VADEIGTGERIARTADALSRIFATELGRVLREADRALRPILAEALDGDRATTSVAARSQAMKRRIRQALTRAGYDALVDASTVTAVHRMADAVLVARYSAFEQRAFRLSPERLNALVELGRANLLRIGDEAAAAMWQSLSQWLFTMRPTQDILFDIAEVFEDRLGTLQTLFDTQVSMYGRQVEAMATAGAPADQPFMYVGPVDATTRAWCLDRVGKVYTRDVIEAMDNGQLANPFVTAGGYNCRHSFIAVQDDELRALTNTGQVAPEFADQLAFVAAQRAQRVA
jgi:hypothetical protein